MRFAVIVSTKDPAGLNIKEALMRIYDFQDAGKKFDNHPVYSYQDIMLYTTDTDTILCEDIDEKIDADIFIFATRHKSQSGIPSLSVHTTGNWGKADKDFGGKDKTLCVAPTDYLKQAIKYIEANNQTDFEVVQECTHHGPFIKKPIMFIEIGSSEKQWGNIAAADTIAATIIHITISEPFRSKTAFGIGGLHTTPNFKKIMMKTDISVGHVCPKYMLENLDEEMIKKAIKNNHPNIADIIILDWKGLGTEKERIIKILKELDIPFTRTSEF